MGYDGKAAYEGARLSGAVYRRWTSAVRRELAAIVTDHVEIVIRKTLLGNSRVALVATPERLLLIFRGTEKTSIRSILANTKGWPRRWGKGRVHTGFFRLAWRARKVLLPEINRYNDGTRRVTMVGHSQGGAAAFLAAMLPIVFRQPSLTAMYRKATVYTYGQPRSADPAFCRQAEGELGDGYSRVANHGDPVVGVPWAGRWYDHCRDYVHYPTSGIVEFRRQPPGAKWPMRGARIRHHDSAKYARLAAANQHIPKP